MSNDTSARLAAIKDIPAPRLLELAQVEAVMIHPHWLSWDTFTQC